MKNLGEKPGKIEGITTSILFPFALVILGVVFLWLTGSEGSDEIHNEFRWGY